MPRRRHTRRTIADLVADKLTSDELDQLTELLDGDAHSEILDQLNTRNAIKNPQSYERAYIATPKNKRKS